MADLGQDETAEPEPSDRDLTEDGTGRLGLAFNNPYLQRDKSLCGRALAFTLSSLSRITPEEVFFLLGSTRVCAAQDIHECSWKHAHVLDCQGSLSPLC